MEEVEIDVLGGSANEIFNTPSPSQGESKQIDDEIYVEYKSDLAVKSIEGDAFRFILHQTAEIGEFAAHVTLYEILRKVGADRVHIAGEIVEVEKESIKKRLEEVLGKE